jgi:hypothetical protein
MKRVKQSKLNSSKDILFIDESIAIHRKKGNGIVKRQAWKNSAGEISRYSLTYINYQLFQGDNGRVLGYDNAHGYHHKHFMGKIEPVTFISFEETEQRFQQEFEVLHEKSRSRN